MSIRSLLASQLGHRGDEANVVLAKKIADTDDVKAIEELFQLLADKDKNVQSDAIKVIYEVAVLNPSLVAPHFEPLVKLLNSKNARLLWGAMTAIDAITETIPATVYSHLPEILKAADKGSVIARDHVVGTLVKLASVKDYVTESKTLLLEQLHAAPTNQLPMYAEMIVDVANAMSKQSFVNALNKRLPDIDKESKAKRVEKVIKKLQAIK